LQALSEAPQENHNDAIIKSASGNDNVMREVTRERQIGVAVGSVSISCASWLSLAPALLREDFMRPTTQNGRIN
jgi:hypothetical protein